MQVDSYPLKDASMMDTDIACCNMVEAIIDVVKNLYVEAKVEAKTDISKCQMVDIAKDTKHVEETASDPQFDEKMCKWIMSPFGVKNDGAAYQKVKEIITSEQNVCNKTTVYLTVLEQNVFNLHYP